MDDTYLSPICIGSLPLCKAGVEVGGFSTHPRASTYQEANKCLTNLRAIYIDSNHLYYQLTIVTQVVWGESRRIYIQGGTLVQV
jgi:hypothetical protein